jgi:hypothetical protein
MRLLCALLFLLFFFFWGGKLHLSTQNLPLLSRAQAVLGGERAGVSVPPPDAFHMTRHGSDPLMLGAYSTVKPGLTLAQFNAMIAPLRAPGDDLSDQTARSSSSNTQRGSPRVFFGGEHVCAALQGYTHGAYYAGLRAAKGAMDELGISLKVHAHPMLQPYAGECELT